MLNRNHAYSLAELVTVTAIIALLTALLIPAFIQVRLKSRQTNCEANLKQVCHALSLYTMDYDGVYPPIFQDMRKMDGTWERDAVWLDTISPYIQGEATYCPSATLSISMQKKENYRSKFSGYAMNAFLSQMTHLYDRKPQGKGDAQLSSASLTVIAFDVRAGIVASTRPDARPYYRDMDVEKHPFFYLHGYISEIAKQKDGATRHNGGANYAFADGHVKWLRPEQLSASPISDGVHPGFGL